MINNNVTYDKYRMYITNSLDGDYAMVTELKFLVIDSCANKSFIIVPNDVAKDSIVSYQWEVNGVATGTSVGALDLANFELGDTVRCNIVISNTCATSTTGSNYTIIQAGNATAIATINSEMLTAHPAGATYQWFNCDSNSQLLAKQIKHTPPLLMETFQLL
ncbi:MAG: hypothetical protein IPG89_06715 [Bacteroidetes bacterium]|nr:hypothetical protein [Bacteroidota bacterium]